MLVGIDLDNTIIRYDNCLYKIASRRGVVPGTIPVQKRAIRDYVRAEYGDIEWQKLQIAIYGDLICEAELMPGVWEFLSVLKEYGHSIKIISHKTRYPNYGDVKVDLRECALYFLRENGFFDAGKLAMTPEDVFFLSTRKEKVQKIKEQGCELFIDDLEEVFVEPGFPSGVRKVLFAPDSEGRSLPGAVVLSSFEDIARYIQQVGEASNA